MLSNVKEHFAAMDCLLIVDSGWLCSGFVQSLACLPACLPACPPARLPTYPPVHAGGLLGGLLGDWAAQRWPNHGRVFVCQFSVGIGVPLSVLLFKAGGGSLP
jgi:hypothetical protein